MTYSIFKMYFLPTSNHRNFKVHFMKKLQRSLNPKPYLFILIPLSISWIIIFHYTDLEEEPKVLVSAKRNNYTIYSMEDKIQIKEMPQILQRTDNRGRKHCVQNYPSVVMIGVPKCGTGSVRTFLSEHPDIAMEMNSEGVQYFNQRYMREHLWYKSQMPCSKQGQITIENSAQYFTSNVAPMRMFNFNPQMKLIVTVRDPIKRLESEFVQMAVGRPQFLSGSSIEDNIMNPETGEVNDKKMLVAKSIYIKYLRQWLNYFSAEQIHLVDGDEFAVNPVKELKELERFLGIRQYFSKSQFVLVKERGFFCLKREEGVECLEKGKGRPHPNITPFVLTKLKELFAHYNENLFRIFDRRFSWD